MQKTDRTPFPDTYKTDQDPRPKIGPLAAKKNDYEAMTSDLPSNEYEALKIGQENSGFSSEDTDLDLEQKRSVSLPTFLYK